MGSERCACRELAKLEVAAALTWDQREVTPLFESKRMLRWRGDDSLKIYERVNDTDWADWVGKTVDASVDSSIASRFVGATGPESFTGSNVVEFSPDVQSASFFSRFSHPDSRFSSKIIVLCGIRPKRRYRRYCPRCGLPPHRLIDHEDGIHIDCPWDHFVVVDIDDRFLEPFRGGFRKTSEINAETVDIDDFAADFP